MNKIYKLGDLIQECDERNTDLIYGIDDVKGMTITKELIPTKADVSKTDLSSFLIVAPNEFVFNPRTHGKKIGFGYNNSKSSFIISWNNIAFKIKKNMQNIINSDYLFMHFNRDEWDREACFQSWGSSTEVFSWDTLCSMKITLPPLDVQQKYVDIYNAMQKNAASFEQGADDLKLVCDGFIEKLKKDTKMVKIGEFCKLADVRNSNVQCKNVKGLTVYKKFIDTKADMEGVPLSNYKIVEADDIAYVPTTNRNGDKIACGLAEEKCIISTIYNVIKIKKNICLPHYLFLWFLRAEIDRYARYNSWGSARETIDWEDLSNYQIPLPPLSVQKSIVQIYNVYNKRKSIATALKAQIKQLCPVLIRGSLQG